MQVGVCGSMCPVFFFPAFGAFFSQHVVIRGNPGMQSRGSWSFCFWATY